MKAFAIVLIILGLEIILSINNKKIYYKREVGTMYLKDLLPHQ